MSVGLKGLTSVALALVLFLTSPLWLFSVISEKRQIQVFRGDWVAAQIFDEKAPIDYLFVGNSLIWTAIDVEVLEANLPECSGKTGSAVNLSHNGHGSGIDLLTFSRLLKNREIGAIFLPFPADEKSPHITLEYMWDWSDEALSYGREIPAEIRYRIYLEQLLATPRSLVYQFMPYSAVKSSTASSQAKKAHRAVVANQGHLKFELGYIAKGQTREAYRPEISTDFSGLPGDEYILSPHNAKALGDRLSLTQITTPWETSIYSKIFALAAAHGVQVYFLQTPDFRSPELRRAVDFTSAPDTKSVSIPLTDIFPNEPLQDARHYFYNDLHLNARGAEVYSKALAAVLAKECQP